MHWATEMAQKIIQERPNEEVYTCASGISPSGPVHIGNFRELVTTYFVVKELVKLGKKVRFIFSWDDFDRFRKVPGAVDPSIEKYIGLPYSKVPSPDGIKESYARYFQDIFENELKELGIEVEYIYQTKEYTSKRYNKYIVHALNKRLEIFDILASFKTQEFTEEDRINYYPVNIYCNKCGKDTTRVISYNEKDTTLEYECDCSFKETINVTDATNMKLQWRVDWPMRWKVENVIFEPGGRDHSSATGSYNVSKIISKEIFDFEPPIYCAYDFIGIKGESTKISASGSKTILLTDLLKVYDKNIILWIYAKYNPNSPFNIAMDEDVIKNYAEFDRYTKSYFNNQLEDEKQITSLKLSMVTDNYINHIPFNYLATFLPMVNYDEKLLRGLLEKEGIEIDEKLFSERLERAKNWLDTYGENYRIELLKIKNDSYYETLSDKEKEWVNKLNEILKEDYTSTEELQSVLYKIPYDNNLDETENKKIQKRFFQIVYNLLLGENKGPKLGLFLLALNKEEYLKLLDF